MPGICGIIRGEIAQEDRKRIRMMVKSMLHEKFYVSGTYSNEKRGYWSGAFKTPSMDARGFGHLIKYLTKNEKGRWILRDEKMSQEESDRISNSTHYGSPFPRQRKVRPGGKFDV